MNEQAANKKNMEEGKELTGLEKGDHLTILLDVLLVIIVVVGLLVIFYVMRR